MRSLSTVVAASCLLSLLPVAVAVPGPNTLGMKFDKRRVSAVDSPLRRRQQNTVLAGLDNELALYLINVTVGTPPQPFSLQLDTGSSDIWFPSNNAQICQQDGGQDCPAGTYDASASSTFSEPDLPEFQIEYVDGTKIGGTYITDVLNIGNTKLTNLTMAAATSLNSLGLGIMGVGFSADESLAAQGGSSYPNIVDVLQSEGFIESRSYSLWLDDLDSSTGSILFGGVDSDKFTGDLVALPIQLDSQSNRITSFTVAWTGLKVTGSGNNADMSPSAPVPAILDSGTTDTLLPDDIATAIYNGVGVTMSNELGAVVPCELANDDLKFAFSFGGDGGPTVEVPLSEFVVPIITQSGRSPKFHDGKDACQFAIEQAGQNPILFGDSFLRSAYVVYDLENQNIGLAQTNFNASGSNGKVQAIGSSSGIPGVTATATAASVAQSFSGIPRESDEVTATATGDIGSGQTSFSATFQLSATGSGGSSATSSGVASSNLRPMPFEWQSWAISSVVMLGMVLGGGLVLL
ncbi:uncharacterized protein HMPREF1541_09120 [Cyphellophora europaea CBS 101466]|uniref:Peptidase A1 domain-containing protein n=1 Tax=Cyphellophora europaea (strain CBS 101466) TaxID=1220924 RepID=W2SBI3_CYPE1|nr:uncharacterized protein HMPREF1541_09120 [Cyphellophora europaea CBS 101466]ETN45289.1 hypothetical protein HMPREF1541_09120 [Cyphellophora europaea CBS 101466]